MLLLSLLACNPWNLPQVGQTWLDEETWDPAVVSARDGVYVRLPAAGDLVRVTAEGWTSVELNGAEPDRMVLAPDGETLFVFSSWPVCEDDDPDIRYIEDCPEDDLATEHELVLVRDGQVVKTITAVPPEYNALAFDPTGTLAVAYLDFSEAAEVQVTDVLNLTEAVFIDLSDVDAEPVPVSIGFAAESVLFMPDGSKAVVLSRSEVAVVDLAAMDVTVSFPLTLDVDQEVSPDDVALVTYEDTSGFVTQYALVSVQGQSDLYVLDLTEGSEHIDLVDLRAVPSDLLVDDELDQTLVIYSGSSTLDLLSHSNFEIEAVELDEPMTRAERAGDGALLYNDGGTYHDVYWFDPTNNELVEFRAENPVMELWLTSDGSAAVATLDRENDYGGGDFFDGYYGLAIFDLVGQGDPDSLALASEPVGFELLEGDSGAHALLLLDGVDELLMVDLATGSDTSFELEEPPLGIDAMPDGAFVVTHASPMGLVTFVDPADPENVTVVSGFATTGLLGDTELPRRAEEE